MNSFFVTTAISYVNGKPHLGHAYEAIACDVLARYKRLSGVNTFFLTGTDEHGEKNERSANKEGLSPQEFTKINSDHFEDMTNYLNISNDYFIRTSSESHHIASKALWNKLVENNEIYIDKYEGWYSIVDETFINEDEIIDGPNKTKLGPSGDKLEWLEEPSYFFKLSKWTNKLLEFYKENPDFIKPKSRRNEVINFVKQGLNDLSISRQRLKWGIKVPNDNKHVMYVWLDALTNYLTAINYPDISDKKFKCFWPADFHVIGKDIVRFHAVYWPAFLMSAGLEPPKTIFCHGFLNINGSKMSKSLGNVLSPKDLVEKYGLDQLRYFLLREVPFGQDGNFSHTQITQRINNDLANDYGNLSQRVLSFINKNCSSQIPEYFELNELDQKYINKFKSLNKSCDKLIIDNLEFHNVLIEIWSCISSANQYIDEQAPWKLKNNNNKRMETILYLLACSIKYLTIMLQPFMPSSCSLILDQLAVENNNRSFNELNNFLSLKPGTQLPKPTGIFPRFTD